jgi:uncharacterized oxidoreductase
MDLKDKTLAWQDLQAHVAGVLLAAGSLPAEAEEVAANLVMANLCGHDSHGVGMLPRYVDAVLEGGLQPNAGVKVLLDTGSLLTLDGQRGYGQVTGVAAMKLGMERAQQHGSCIMTLANTHHLGRIGHLAEMAVAQGLVSVHFVNVIAAPVVAPWGGSDGRFGTNPCCIGIPLAGAAPFVLDFATSRVAHGKMRVAHNKGQTVAEGYVLDEYGQPSTNPAVVIVPQTGGLLGSLLTFGEHKGYGLAVACELLGGALSGGDTGHRPADGSRAVINSMLTILIDPARLGTQRAFESESRAFMDWLRQSPPGAGFDQVQIAGEPERASRAARERDGIVVDAATWQEILEAGRKLGLP